MVSGPSPPSDQGQAALVRGATIGRYVILGMVGRGGMGEVYAAYDPELDRKVAVKLLRVKPGAVESQSRSWQEVVKVFMAAGRGLQAAHEKGLVHRDFKPDNVMVGKDNQVRVMDFGLALQVHERDDRTTPVEGSGPRRLPVHVIDSAATTQPVPGPDVDPMATLVLNMAATGIDTDPSQSSTMFEAQLTRTGAMMGTPAYMAPEQFLGTPTDARSDQFSFCISLYEALYGERPFEGA